MGIIHGRPQNSNQQHREIMENGESAKLAEWFYFSSSLGWFHPPTVD